MLDEQNIPPELLAQARAWFARQMALLERAHRERWPANRDWLVDYLNAEVQERLSERARG
jgi:hypothetical protein